MNQVVIYTDGACKGNPGPGGWGVLLQSGGTTKELYGGEQGTTNNRMEMMAVIQGLSSFVPRPTGRLSRRYDRCYPSFRCANPGEGWFSPED